MTTVFPVSLDTFTNPTSTSTMDNPPHDVQHTNANDAISALQHKVGTTASTDTASLDYQMTHHLHDATTMISGTSGISVTHDTQTGKALVAPVYGTTASTVCSGNDTRLADTRTPSNDANLVHLSGTETITGAKIFTAGILANGNISVTNSSADQIALTHTGYTTNSIRSYQGDMIIYPNGYLNPSIVIRGATSNVELPTGLIVWGKTWTAGWTAYTPTLTGDSGTQATLTVTYARYIIFGKTCHLNMRIIVTAKWTATGGVKLSLPTAGVASYAPFAGSLVAVWVNPMTASRGMPVMYGTSIMFSKLAETSTVQWTDIAVNDEITISGVYETT